MDRILTGTTTPGQSGHESNGNNRILHIPQASRRETSPSDGLASYTGHSLRWGPYPSVDMLSVPSDQATNTLIFNNDLTWFNKTDEVC